MVETVTKRATFNRVKIVETAATATTLATVDTIENVQKATTVKTVEEQPHYMVMVIEAAQKVGNSISK